MRPHPGRAPRRSHRTRRRPIRQERGAARAGRRHNQQKHRRHQGHLGAGPGERRFRRGRRRACRQGDEQPRLVRHDGVPRVPPRGWKVRARRDDDGQGQREDPAGLGARDELHGVFVPAAAGVRLLPFVQGARRARAGGRQRPVG